MKQDDQLIPFGALQKWLIFICGGGWGVSNAVQVGLGILLNDIHQVWGVSYLEQSLVSILAMVGSFFGSNFWGFLADRYGRKSAFSKLLLFVVIGIGIGVFSPNVWMLATCYLIVGFGIGGSYAVDGNVFLEFCPPNKQYLLTSLSALSSLGSCLPPALTLIYINLHAPYQWQLVQASIAFVALVVTVPRFWIKETPTFLMNKHKTTMVVEMIQDMNKEEDRGSLVERILQASPKEKIEEKSLKEQIRCLFNRPLRKMTWLYIAIWAASSFTFSGMSSFMPAILIRAGFKQGSSEIYTTMLLQQFGEI